MTDREREKWRTPSEQSDEGSADWAAWDHDQRRRAATGYGRRGGYGGYPDDSSYSQQGREEGMRGDRRRTRRDRRGNEPMRAGSERFAGGAYDREGFGQGTYDRAGYGEGGYRAGGYGDEHSGPSGYDQPNTERERASRRDYSMRGERGYGDYSRGRPPHTENLNRDAYEFGRYQGGYQGAYEDHAPSEGYGAETDDDRNAYYETLDQEGSVYGHGSRFEGRDFRKDYSYGGGPTEGHSTPGIRRGEFYGRGPRGYTRSDERIREDICDRLTSHGELDVSDVDVKVEGGEVTLEGRVDSRRVKHAIENVADSVLGVLDVHNHVRVTRREPETSQSTRSES